MTGATLRSVEPTPRVRDGFPQFVDLAARAGTEPPRREWIVEALIPRKVSVLLGAHGGSGKTLLALQLAVCVALGRPFFGQAVAAGTVVALFAEDDADELHRRLSAICADEGVSLSDLVDRLFIFDGVGVDVSLFSRRAIGDDGRTYAISEPDVTDTFRFVERACQINRADLLILDSVSDCYDSEENTRAQVRRYLSRTLGIVLSQRGSVLHLAHVDKLAARTGAAGGQSYSGSTAWHNSVRSRLALRAVRDGDQQQPDDGRRELVVEKINYGRPGLAIPLRYDEAAHVFVRDGAPGDTPAVAAIRDRVERRAIIACLLAVAKAGRSVMVARQSNDNAATVLGPLPDFPAALRSQPGRKRLFQRLYDLEADGLIERETFRTPSRNVAERWRVTAAGREEAEREG